MRRNPTAQEYDLEQDRKARLRAARSASPNVRSSVSLLKKSANENRFLHSTGGAAPQMLYQRAIEDLAAGKSFLLIVESESTGGVEHSIIPDITRIPHEATRDARGNIVKAADKVCFDGKDVLVWAAALGLQTFDATKSSVCVNVIVG